MSAPYEVSEVVEFHHYGVWRWVLGTVESCPSWSGPNTVGIRWRHCLGESVNVFDLHRVRRACAVVQLGNLTLAEVGKQGRTGSGGKR